ncbi:hypothetical protein [Thermovibrio sp.]
MKKLFIFLPVLTLFSFTMCGHRGAPKPPLSKTPSTPEVQGIQQEFNRPLVLWNRVETFSDGRKISAPNKVIYKVIINFGKREVKVRENYFKDAPVKVGEKRCYSVVAIYNGKESKKSEPKCFIGKTPIYEKPKVISVVNGDGFVKIVLAPHKYPIEVFRNQSEPFVNPYKTLKENEDELVDAKVENGKRYDYKLRFYEGEVKGRFTEVVGKPEDKIPPLPPKNPILIKDKECLAVWEPSPSSDVVYYLIKVGKREFKVNGIYFTFKTCPKGFRIVAVDKAGNTSKPVKGEVADEEGSSNNGK